MEGGGSRMIRVVTKDGIILCEYRGDEYSVEDLELVELPQPKGGSEA